LTLETGSRLGPYEILSPLGAGGMGEVYRARDERLKRDVAIKVLPSSVAADGDRLRRFEQEAQAAGSLNHPNITAVYDFGSHEGAPYIVTELLEGDTLRAALAAGPLPLRRALDYGLQMARALAVAHEKGIIHRDLKPENLFVTTDGRLKILDFGLARVTRPEGHVGSDTNFPTMTPGTEPGVVLGTLGYMSPEQVRGRPADARSDIFSFGAILYEMLSGRRAFSGDSTADTMSAILREDPQDLTLANRAIPPGLERIVRHCLEKNPSDRFRSAHDLAFALDASMGGSSTSGAVAPVGARPRPLPRTAIAVFAVLAVAAAAFLAGRLLRGRFSSPAPAPRPVVFQQLTDTRGVESAPTLSPDGKNVVYVSDAAGSLGLYLLRVGGRNPVALTAESPTDNWQPAFSPDGERIAFRSERDGGGIFLMGSTGESVRRLTDFGFNPTWSPDGREIALAAGSFLFASDRAGVARGLWAVEVATGRKRSVLKERDSMQPSWSPHGTRIAYWGLRGNSGQRDLWTVAANGSEAAGEGIAVTNDAALDWSPVWSPDGKFLYFSSNRGGTMNLWRIAIDEASGRVLGEPEPMTTPSLWSGELSFTRDGRRFAFSSLDWRSSLYKAELDPKAQKVGPPVPILRSTQPIRDHQVSPDGKWVAFMQTGGQEDLFVARTNGSEYRRLTDDAFRDRGPSWSPDGQSIAFYSDRSGSYQLWMIRPDGSGLEQLTRINGTANFPVWSPDGTRIATAMLGSDWRLVDMRSKESPRPIRTMPGIDASSRFWPLAWSPDGKRLAGVRVLGDGSAGDVMTFTLDTQRYEKVLDAEDGFWKTPVWLSDSRRLLVRSRRGVALLDTATRRAQPLLGVRGYWIGLSLGISRDDRWITYTETGTEGDIWLAELK